MCAYWEQLLRPEHDGVRIEQHEIVEGDSLEPRCCTRDALDRRLRHGALDRNRYHESCGNEARA